MDKVTKSQAEKKAKDLIKHLREKKPNDYDVVIIMQFANWWVDQHTNERLDRAEVIRLAIEHSPEGTEEEAILKKADTYYKFIVNNLND